MFRIGHGFDVHELISPEDFKRLYPERQVALIIGGIKIPYEKVLKGHSDADVLLHAITDALLGAAGLDDIGTYFPPTDKQFAGMDSSVFLLKAKEMLLDKGFKIGNIDCTIIAEKPKFRPYINQIREKLSGFLGISLEDINVKATTTEGLGFLGRGEGIAVEAVCLLVNT